MQARLGPDIVAGIILAALGIPEVMRYTRIIGTPVITRLYTLFLPVVEFAILESSRHFVVSADSAVRVRHQGKLEQLGLLDLISSELIYESREERLAAYKAATLGGQRSGGFKK